MRPMLFLLMFEITRKTNPTCFIAVVAVAVGVNRKLKSQNVDCWKSFWRIVILWTAV